ncbi:Uncharacterised protein [Mycobacterium tuberculosis]|uniref:Uncharacterized protein n=1 Tax=Mycobacterium tuberculosis TaxID=1773 RepID=A0A0T9E083_MYCTX|nr:Uncharacterised protein [Mycobacterium tuberculosis]CKS74862.1 Uncharacterised protein [Mycobacterium tuberculosis]CKT58429.1 Uncharacterised protein [Mycobacterium tuberculosis]CNL68062.1 Uncharacterised protein [Mycobacterium tuberculosis]CNM60276.1 Uncharacterised protein [Mycobacterium tuberculosis]
MLGKDVEDQRGAVNNLNLHSLFQGGQLRRRQFAVADDGVGAGRHDHFAEFGRFARADVGRRVGLVATLDESFEHLGAGGFGQCRQLGQACPVVSRAALGPHSHQHHPLQAQLAVLHLGDVGKLGRQPGNPAQRRSVLECELTEARCEVRKARLGRIWICHSQYPMVARGSWPRI